MRVFKVKATGERDAFYKILLLLDEALNIRLSALKVFADLIYFNWKYRDLPSAQRDSLVFSYQTRGYIMDKFKINTATLNNQLSYLRKKGLIKDTTINKTFQIDLYDYLDILFKIEIQDGISKKPTLDKS